MAFNNDISVTDVFDKLYGQVTGTKADGVNELEVCYCIGLGLGIILFFNHVGRKKITPDPTPIQIEMRKYEKCNRAANTLYFEQAIILGGILGNIVSVFLQMHIPLGQVSGHIFRGLYGLSAGMFVGCIAVALAEILNTFPILFRRAKLKVGLQWVMWTMAVGKTCGALYYFVKKIGEGLS